MGSQEKNNLRKRAEELRKLYDSDKSSSIREGDALKLLHELEVHQIELELTNDELILSRDQAETLTSKYTALYDFAPMGYLTIDRVGTISELNFSAAKMLGSDRSLLVGRDFKTFIDINELPSFSAFLIQVFYLKTKQICELKLEKSDPNAHAYCRLEGIIDADDSCMIAMVDISLSKQHENELKEAQRRAKKSEKYLINILNKIGDPLFVKDEQSRLLLVNDSFCKLFGLLKKNVVGKTLAEDVLPEEMEHFLRIDKQVLATGRQSIVEESLTLQDQETQIISTRKNRYVDDEGKKFLIGTIRNITGQKQAADKLRRSTQLLEASQTIARVGGWELELTSGDLFWTAETYRIHDTSPEEFNPTVDAGVSYFLPESRRIITEALRAATEEGKDYDLELETYTTKGRLISVRTTCEVVFADGKPVKLVGIFQDITEHKQHQNELIQSKLLLQSSIESPKDMIIISLDTKYNYLYFNTAHLNAMKQVYGTKPKVSKCIFDYITSVEEVKKLKINYKRALKGESHVGISQYGEGDACVYYETKYSPILDDHNVIIGVSAFAQNITERIKADAEIRYQASVIEQVDSAIITIDNANKILSWNDRAEQLYLWKKEEAIGRDIIEILSPQESKKTTINNFVRLNRDGIWEGDYEAQRKDGTTIPVHIVTTKLKNSDGEDIGFIGVSTDITERQQIQNALEASEEKFRNAITYAPYPIMIHAEGNVVQLSDEWIRQSGYTHQDIPTIKKWSSLAYGKDAIPSNEFINKLYDIEKPQSDGEWEVKTKDGSHVLWSFSSSPIGKLPNGKKMVISMASDITEIKNYREHLEELVDARTTDLKLRTTELKKANEGLLHAESEMHKAYEIEKELGELKSRFVSTASHQFRTPLTVIQSNVELMEMNLDKLDGSLRARFEKSFERINKESYRMTALMDDVLILGKINANAVDRHPEWIDVTALTRDMIQRLNEVDKSSSKIHFKMSGDPKEIFVDENQYSHILLNLLSNAQKYTVDQSDIALQLAFDNKQLKITIEDHGIGMSQADLKTVFQPFTRGRNTEGIQGTGLGMSIVQEYISLNNGKIKIDSELNVGTTVTLTFTYHEQ